MTAARGTTEHPRRRSTDRPFGYHCWGCARHFVPKGTPQPIRRSEWVWREFLCSDPTCPANDIIKGMRR